MQRAAALSEPLDTTVDVETPEHVRFRYQIAGPARRGAAYLIDLTARAVFLVALAIGVGVFSAFGFGGFGGFEIGAMLLVFFAVEWGYYVASELLMNGSSLGKKALRLRVVQSDGLPITFTDSLLRNLVRAADLLPTFYVLGLLSMILDSKFRRLGDFVAGTLVVHEPSTSLRPRANGVRRLDPGDPELVLAVQREAESLPQRPTLDREERQALTLFVRRRGTLSPQRAEELADMIAPALAARWGARYRNSADFLEAVHRRASLRANPGGQ